MKQAKKLPGAEALIVKVTFSKEMEQFSGKILFPEKLKAANKIIGKLK